MSEGQNIHILPRQCTADAFSSMKFTSTSMPAAPSSSSSLSESSENYLSFEVSSITATTPLSDLHDLMTSVNT
jgi:hypothetical protein